MTFRAANVVPITTAASRRGSTPNKFPRPPLTTREPMGDPRTWEHYSVALQDFDTPQVHGD